MKQLGPITRLYVQARPGNRSRGVMLAGNRTLRCALGRSGIGIKRGEGDGITPLGQFALLEAKLRKDRGQTRITRLPTTFISGKDGWCDEVGDRNYNRSVELPYAASHESMMRDDALYDIVVVMDFNIRSRMTRGGSAIFFHLAHNDYRPTEGCIAISRADMEWLLPRIGPETEIIVR